MFSDIIISKNNEAEFIEIASRLGIKKLYFLYDFDKCQNQKSWHASERVNGERGATLACHTNSLTGQIFDFGIGIGFIVNQKNINKALNQSKLLVAKSSDKDRFFIESRKIKLIYGFEEIQKRDYLRQRASGLNHTICELCRENNIAVGMPYSFLFNKNPTISSLIMGRMMQNIKLCQKYKVKTVIGSFSEKPFDMRSQHDIISFFSILGMDRKKIKESLTYNL